jgi:hypothetical protein
MPRFNRTRPVPVVTGGYAAFRPHVRRDFERRCAYRLLKERFAGGQENFELDHFRPKSRFPEGEKDFYNLYYACHVCNNTKQAYWPPSELLSKGIGFVDLCVDDFETHFRQGSQGMWEGLTPSGRYTIDVLRLNRKHLVTIRRILFEFRID